MPKERTNSNNHLSQLQLNEKLQRSRKRRFRNRLTLGISLVLIGLYSLDLGFDRRSETFARTPNALNIEKDLLRAAKNIEVKFFDQEGKKNMLLIATSAEFGAPHAMTIPDSISDAINLSENDEDYLFQDEASASSINHLLLKPVRILSYKEDQLNTVLESNFAFINALENEVHLSGNVSANNMQRNSVMKTEDLIINTESRHIYGDKLVTIELNNALTQAVGVQGSQLDGRWQLLSKVKTTLKMK